MAIDESIVPASTRTAEHAGGGLVEWVTTVGHKKIGILYSNSLLQFAWWRRLRIASAELCRL